MREFYNKDIRDNRKKIKESLIEWGFSDKLIKKILSKEHKVKDIAKIVQETKKRKPDNPAKYFLSGLNYYREKAGKKPLYKSLSN